MPAERARKAVWQTIKFKPVPPWFHSFKHRLVGRMYFFSTADACPKVKNIQHPATSDDKWTWRHQQCMTAGGTTMKEN